MNDTEIALLSFYNLTEKIPIEQLADIPIDLALLNNKRNHRLSQNRTFRNKAVWTFPIHLCTAGLYLSIYSVPALLSGIKKKASGGILLILPAAMITYLWGGTTIRQKNTAKKILLSFWLIINVAVSTAYLILIHNIFTHQFF